MPGGEQITRWPLPPSNKIQNFSLWQLGSSLVIPAVGILSKLMAGILDWRHVLNSRIMRWTAAAHDICFTNDWHAQFFALGKTIPVIRGAGVYQRGMDFCLDRLNAGAWVHFFPEGKVNMAKNEFIRLKWGIGRLIAECKICPIVIPFWHLGMDSVLPNVEPYRPKIGQKVTIYIGNPIDFTIIRDKFSSEYKSAVKRRKVITDKIQEQLFQLKPVTERLHVERYQS
ncbi:tafazzin-like isoform X2 [Uloborus diversus]|uniref:tafazzin-like isoform X2 n=1 Tax=Uloborus diversus TaxID=327109 RepID=UPI0024095D77|nr:tafazzin-like isoform X2 [Uloborus diversus]